MLVSFNSAIFLLKYREELILLYPIIILLFSAYFYLSIELPYKAVFPEKVYLNKYIIILTFFSFFLFFILFYFDLPLIENLIQKKVFS
jgi:preprotein translocase subunit SecE